MAFSKYLNTPRMQRLALKRNRMTQDQQAILNSFLSPEEASFLDAMARREVTGARFAGRRAEAKTRLDLTKEGFDIRQTIGRERLASREKTAFADIASREGINIANLESQYGTKYRGLEREKAAYPWELGLGLGGVVAQAGAGYADYRGDIRAAERADKLARKYGIATSSYLGGT